MSTDDRVVTLLREAVARGEEASGISIERATRTGRRRVAARTALQVGGAVLAAAVLAVATVVVPGLVDRAGPAGPSVSVTPEPTQNPVRRLYAAYDLALARNGLPVGDTRWDIQPYVRMGPPGEFEDFPGSRSLQNFGNASSPVAFQTVAMDEAAQPTTQVQLCDAYLANGLGCETSSPAEGLTLVRLLDRPGGTLSGVELWHPDGVVVASRQETGSVPSVTDDQLLDLALDPELRW